MACWVSDQEKQHRKNVRDRKKREEKRADELNRAKEILKTCESVSKESLWLNAESYIVQLGISETCQSCYGNGTMYGHECSRCHGHGKVVPPLTEQRMNELRDAVSQGKLTELLTRIAARKQRLSTVTNLKKEITDFYNLSCTLVFNESDRRSRSTYQYSFNEKIATPEEYERVMRVMSIVAAAVHGHSSDSCVMSRDLRRGSLTDVEKWLRSNKISDEDVTVLERELTFTLEIVKRAYEEVFTVLSRPDSEL